MATSVPWIFGLIGRMDYPILGLSALFALILLFGIVGTVVGTRRARRERELEHLERLKALELGRILPRDVPFWTPAHLCVAVGVALPIALFVLALAASRADRELVPFVWPVAGALGGIGIICGTILALIPPRRAAERDRADKPPLDPDSYDTAGRRGRDEMPATPPTALRS